MARTATAELVQPAATASSSSAATSSSKVMPAACAASGAVLVSVRPGTTLTSRIQGGAPSGTSRSTRAKAPQPRARHAAAATWAGSGPTSAGTANSVAPGV